MFALWLADLGLFQTREKTCIALAARGARDMDAGEELIADRALARQPRAKATAPHRGLRREFINDVCDLAVLTDVSIAMWRELEQEAE